MRTISTLRTMAFLLLGTALAAQTAAPAPRRPGLAVAPVHPAAPVKAPVAKAGAPTKRKPAQPAPKPQAVAEAKTESAPQAADANKTASVAHRDPFMSIIRDRGVVTPVCTAAGKQCLIPDQLVLRGVVKSPDGMIALVENAQRKAYFLREKDPVMNGEVVHITGDSITFRQKVTDRAGRVNTRDVVKRIPGAAPA